MAALSNHNAASSPDTSLLTERYQELNGSYKRSLAYGVGIHAGFFSEINLLILAVVYCLHHKIQFKLHSGSANFRRDLGWTDYFQPFCIEVRDAEYDEVDKRERPRFTFDINKPRRLYRMAKSEWSLYALRKKLGVDYITSDLLGEILNRKLEKIHYEVPELGIDGDLRHACRVISQIVWKLNEETRAHIKQQESKLKLPPKYVGFQIRRGDKDTETQLSNLDKYVRIATAKSATRDAFVLTDDYTAIEEFQEKYPDWRIHTMCQLQERGYVHGDFFSKSREEIYQGTMKLIANIEILQRAECFVGTFSANPSMFLGMVMEGDRAASVDVPWQVWYGKEV